MRVEDLVPSRSDVSVGHSGEGVGFSSYQVRCERTKSFFSVADVVLTLVRRTEFFHHCVGCGSSPVESLPSVWWMWFQPG